MSTYAKALALAFFAALLVCLLQRSEINRLKAEIAGIETAFARAQVSALQASLEVTNTIFAARDNTYADIRDAGREAQQAIFSAGSEDDRAAPDDFVPLALSNALVMQSAGVRSGSGGNSAPGCVVRPEGSAGGACGTGATHDTAADGGLVEPVYSLGW